MTQDIYYLAMSLAWSAVCLFVGGVLGFLLALLREKLR